MIFINAIVLYIILNKRNPLNTGYRWLHETVAPKCGKWMINLLGCTFCILGWLSIVEGLLLGYSVSEIAMTWALSVIIYNFL